MSENVYVCKRDQYKICEFGPCKYIGEYNPEYCPINSERCEWQPSAEKPMLPWEITHLDKVKSDVCKELSRQRHQWGEQMHAPEWWIAILGEEYGEVCKAALEHTLQGRDTEKDYRKELIEVAAVAISAAECFDKKD